MSCTLATLAACFSMSGIYVDTGLDYQNAGEWRPEYETFHSEHNGVLETGGTWLNVTTAQNPYARLGLGYQAELSAGRSKVVFELEAWHESSVATGRDHGVNSIGLHARVFPFARQ
jgi:hypothetical protein